MRSAARLNERTSPSPSIVMIASTAESRMAFSVAISV